ncbi:MAG: glycosyltransferase family 1 protein [Candidatus Gottesmanbacteria bacterium]
MKQPDFKLNTKYLLYVGNAYPHKNLEKLLEAILNIKHQVLITKLILVGPDDYFYQQLKEKVNQMGLVDKVIFYGSATHEELKDLYKNALALIFPSLMEGFGLPGVEAMANSCPVICSDIPVFHEIYGDAAIYFNTNDANDIADKMKIVVSDQYNKQTIIVKGLLQSQKYSWKKLAEETLEIYKI